MHLLLLISNGRSSSPQLHFFTSYLVSTSKFRLPEYVIKFQPLLWLLMNIKMIISMKTLICTSTSYRIVDNAFQYSQKRRIVNTVRICRIRLQYIYLHIHNIATEHLPKATPSMQNINFSYSKLLWGSEKYSEGVKNHRSYSYRHRIKENRLNLFPFFMLRCCLQE